MNLEGALGEVVDNSSTIQPKSEGVGIQSGVENTSTPNLSASDTITTSSTPKNLNRAPTAAEASTTYTPPPQSGTITTSPNPVDTTPKPVQAKPKPQQVEEYRPADRYTGNESEAPKPEIETPKSTIKQQTEPAELKTAATPANPSTPTLSKSTTSPAQPAQSPKKFKVSTGREGPMTEKERLSRAQTTSDLLQMGKSVNNTLTTPSPPPRPPQGYNHYQQSPYIGHPGHYPPPPPPNYYPLGHQAIMPSQYPNQYPYDVRNLPPEILSRLQPRNDINNNLNSAWKNFLDKANDLAEGLKGFIFSIVLTAIIIVWLSIYVVILTGQLFLNQSIELPPELTSDLSNIVTFLVGAISSYLFNTDSGDNDSR